MHVYFTSVGTIHLLSWETEVIWSKHTDPVIVFPVIDKEGSITSVSPLGEDQLVQSNWRFRVPQAPPNRLFCSPVWWVLSRPPVQTKLWWEKELFHHKHITTFCTRVRLLMEPESTTVKSVSIDRSQFCCLVCLGCTMKRVKVSVDKLTLSGMAMVKKMLVSWLGINLFGVYIKSGGFFTAGSVFFIMTRALYFSPQWECQDMRILKKCHWLNLTMLRPRDSSYLFVIWL